MDWLHLRQGQEIDKLEKEKLALYDAIRLILSLTNEPDSYWALKSIKHKCEELLK